MADTEEDPDKDGDEVPSSKAPACGPEREEKCDKFACVQCTQETGASCQEAVRQHCDDVAGDDAEDFPFVHHVYQSDCHVHAIP